MNKTAHCCQNNTKPISTSSGQNEGFLMLKQMVHNSLLCFKVTVNSKITVLQNVMPCSFVDRYTAFGMLWHTVTHGRGSEGETGEWSG